MKTTTLGRTGLQVSRVAFGTWQLGGDWGRYDEDAAITAIRRARECSVNFFATAQACDFGASEQNLGKVLRDQLKGKRDELVIATKSGLRQTDSGLVRDASPEWRRHGVGASLTVLGIDHIDLYQVHWPDPTVPAADTAGALCNLVADGKIGHVGESNYSTTEMAEFAKTLPVETLEPPYHLFRRDIEDGVLPYCHAHDTGVLAYGPLAHGPLTGTRSTTPFLAEDDWRNASGEFSGDTFRGNLETVRDPTIFAASRGVTVSQLAIAWTLANPAVHVAIVGARQAGHVEDSLAAVEVSLSDADLDEIDKIMTSATAVAGPSPEGM